MGQLVRSSCSITDTFNSYFMDQEKNKHPEVQDVMKYEWMRLASFAKFPLSSPAHPTRLAEAGFYFQGIDDEVTCFRCGVKHKGWRPGDVAANIHKDVSPHCPFLTERDTINFGIKQPPWNFRNGNDNNALNAHDNNIPVNIDNFVHNGTVINGESGACGGPRDLNGTSSPSPLSDSSVKQDNDTLQRQIGERISAADSDRNNSNDTNQLNTYSNGHIGSESGQVSENRPSNNPFNFSFVPSRSRDIETPRSVTVGTNGNSNGSSITNGNSRNVPNGSNITNGNLRNVPNGSNITNGNSRNVPNSSNRTSGNSMNAPNGCDRSDENLTTITNGQNRHQSPETPSDETSEHEALGLVLQPLGISCEKPVHPQYAISAIRMSSYKNWPKSCRQRPEELTRAGLFYEGTDDRVRCFFCGGGLFNWEADDDPWIEHARWFPKCVYLRQSKGDEFIYKVHQEVQRGANDFSHLKDYKPDQHAQTNSASATSDGNDVMSHPAVISVLDMGTDSALVRKAMEAICKLNGTKTLTAEKLLLKVWEIEDSGGTTNNDNDEQSTNSQSDEHLSNGSDTPGSADTKTDDEEAERLAIIEENRHLRELQLCKICLDEDVSIVFLPCGHMATCASCAPALRKCPICRVFIKGTVKAIIS